MTKINATKGEFVNLINGLFKVQTLQGKKFGLKVSKNISKIQEALKDLETMGTPSEEFMALAQKVNELANSGAEDAKEQVDKLEEENKELVKARQEQMEKVSEAMKESLELELEIISEDLLPETITAQQITGIQKIIE
tara:strand:+ start:843 stop:1256 length:414 start_codon:yes stop_codon:yes gene_type:complete